VARITGQRVSVNLALKFKYLVDGSIIDKRKFGIRCDVLSRLECLFSVVISRQIFEFFSFLTHRRRFSSF
jgi:hypothetical protein